MAQSWNGLHREENFQLLEGTSVQVYVGPEAQCWVLHTELVCHLSSYFKAALNGGFKEAEEKRVTLDEDDPNAFRIFVAWLYTGEIKPPKSTASLLPLAWILGDKLGAPAFQDCAMIQLITPSGSDFPWHPQIVEHIYENTTEGSLLRAATADNVSFYRGAVKPKEAEWMAFFLLGGDFVVDVMKIWLYPDKLKDPRLVQDKYLFKPVQAVLSTNSDKPEAHSIKNPVVVPRKTF